MAKKAKKVGRPTKYRPEMCERVLAMGRQGMGRAEIAAELDICRQTLANWEGEHPEFLDATTRASELSGAWWASQGRLGIWSRDFNAAAYRLQVMNRFPDDWRDKQSHELSGPNGGPIRTSELSDEQLVERARTLTNRLAAAAPGVNGNGKH